MKKMLLILAVAISIAFPPFVLADSAIGAPGDSAVYSAPAVPGISPIGGTTYVQMTKSSGGVIDIGQAFSDVIAPYINALVQALILAAVTWFGTWLRTRFKIDLDQKHRDALTSFLQNQASSLIAAGAVRMNGLTVNVDNNMLALAANQAIARVPDAAKHFGLTPDVVAKKIVEMIPQVAAGAQLIAQSHAQSDNGQSALP